MFVRGYVLYGVSLALMASCGALTAQAEQEPSAYSITTSNSFFGPAQITRVFRMGSKVAMDVIGAADATDAKATHLRTLDDLDTHKSLSWSSPGSSSGCTAGTFSGDWGDPFSGLDQLIGPGARQTGMETIHGFAARIMEGASGDTKVRAWVDTKSGLILKVQVSQGGAEPQTVLEVTAASFAPPPASVFVVPASCAAAASAPTPPTDSEKIAALTGGNPQDFVNAIYGPGSTNSCSMLFRVVKAGSMEPIKSGFQVGADLNVATEPTPSYTIGIGTNGHSTFSGGGLHEVTSQIRDGVLRLDKIPAQFDLDVEFGTAGSASANIYRQCFAPQTVLLYVVRNPANISEGGEFLWVKSGKYATVPH